MLTVTAEIGPATGQLTPVEFQVNPASLHTIISPETAQDLGLELPAAVTIAAADNSNIPIPVGLGRIRLLGREGPAMLAAMDTPAPQLGRISLQILGLKLNPATETLEYTIPYPPMV